MFLNCTAHSLTSEQKKIALEYSNILIDLKEEKLELWENLSNCPADLVKIHELVKELMDYLHTLHLQSNGNLTVHFPIGSPAFNAILFENLDRKKLPIRILFSHSDRVSVDEVRPDGSIVKRAVFRFVKFLEI
jgi:hypothetical protein